MIRASGLLLTDLDGTLLDPDTYLPSQEALAALRWLEAMGVVIVAVTSKTGSEVLAVREILGGADLAIVEGGAVVLDGGRLERVGPDRRQLVECLEELQRAGFALRGMNQMSVDEVVERTGLDHRAARLAMNRLASEPFVVTEASVSGASLEAAVAAAGYGLTRGGRFWHLHGRGVSKNRALAEVTARRPELFGARSAAVGDAWNDLPLLASVGSAFLLGWTVKDLDLPVGVVRVEATGPEGFLLAVRLLAERWGLPVAMPAGGVD